MLERFQEEVLFVAGACDVILGPEFRRKQMKYFPRGRMVVIDGVGHEMFAENPAASIPPVRVGCPASVLFFSNSRVAIASSPEHTVSKQEHPNIRSVQKFSGND